jgi:hypothetical protein
MKKVAFVALGLVAVGFIIMLVGFAIGISPLYVNSGGMHMRTLQPETEDFITNYDRSANVTLSFSSQDVTIIEDSSRFGYSIKGRFYQVLDCSLSPDSLTIKEKGPMAIDFGWSGLTLFGRGGFNAPQITIYIPHDMTVEVLDLTLASGDVRIDSINARQMKLNGASGNLVARDLTIEDTFTANLVSGDIKLDSIKAQGMKFSGASGNITARNLSIEQSFIANLVSGDVFVSGDLRGEISLSAASGDMTLEIDGAADDYRWRIDALTADITIRDSSGMLPNSSTRGPNRISLDAISSGISIRFLK